MPHYEPGICHIRVGAEKECGMKLGPNLEDRVEHNRLCHSYSEAQWTDAYNRMLRWKEAAKKSSRADTDY